MRVLTALLIISNGVSMKEMIKSPMFRSDNRNLSSLLQSSVNESCPVSYPIQYSLFFENCKPQFNSDEYYSAGLKHLSAVYYVFCLLHLIFLGHWISVCLKIRPSFRRIHFLMAGLIVTKVCSLICAAQHGYYQKVTGIPLESNLLLHMHQFIDVLRLSIVILLIRNGWTLVKSCLQGIDKKALMILIPVQVFGNIVAIMIREFGEVKFLNEMLSLVDIIIPRVTLVWLLMSNVGMGARVSSRLELFRYFYFMVTTYLMFMRVFTPAITYDRFEVNAIVAYKYLLRSNVVVETNSLLFYIGIFKMFRQYFHGIE